MTSKNYTLVAYSTHIQINLKPIFAHFGLSKKLHWRDFLVITPEELSGILREPTDKFVHLYQFGSIVFTNFSYHESMDFLKYLQTINPKFRGINESIECEEYNFGVDSNANETTTDDDGLTVPTNKPNTLDILADILAKSVAMDRIELDVDKLLHECEEILEKLKVGNLKIGSKKLFKISAEILEFKYNTVSSIRLLDKPEITWTKENLSDLYGELSEQFELKERYHNISAKHETLLEIISVFTSLTQDRRGVRLEWIVIILIGIEVLLMLSPIQLFH